jgi:Tol biopolymer transport system component/DNA-binding winged helix-turn-helix (wHTH) protein
MDHGNRSAGASETAVWHFDSVTVDGAAFRVTVGGAPRALEPKAFRLLQFLIEHRERAVTKAEIFDAVWQGVAVTDNALTRAIAQIRKAIDDDPRQPRYIETVPSVGYRFVAAVHAAASPAGLSLPQPPPPAAPRARVGWRTGMIVAVLAAIVGGTLLFLVLGRRTAPGPPSSTPPLVPVQFSSSSGLDSGPAFSPDGRLVAYATDDAGSFEIVVKSFDAAARELRVTNDGGENLSPAFSPDGQWIAFWSAKRGGVFRVPALGGPVQRLTEFGAHPVYSPDGRWIVFRSTAAVSLSTTDYYWPAQSTLWLVPAEGGPPAELKAQDGSALPGGQAFPTFSADGTEIRFVSHANDESSIWSYRLADRRVRKHFGSTTRRFGNALFSRDDSRMWFVDWHLNGNIGILEQRLDPGTLTPAGDPTVVFPPLFAAPRDLALSPDGRHIAFTATQPLSRILVQPIGTGGPAVSVAENTTFRAALVRTSPDGTHLLYTAFPRNGLARIWMVLAEGAAPVAVSGPRDATQFYGGFTADNAAVLFAEWRGDKAQLWRERLSDGARERLADLPRPVDQIGWSADGSRLVYHDDKEPRRRLYLQDVRSGARQVVAEGAEDYGFGRFSRDDRWISMEISHRARGGDDIGVVPSSGGPIDVILRSTQPTFASGWMPDHDRILFAGFRDGAWNVYSVSRTTRVVEKLTAYDRLRIYVRYPDWVAGNRLTYEYNETRGNVFVADVPPR